MMICFAFVFGFGVEAYPVASLTAFFATLRLRLLSIKIKKGAQLLLGFLLFSVTTTADMTTTLLLHGLSRYHFLILFVASSHF
jgi:hypothetical protein